MALATCSPLGEQVPGELFDQLLSWEGIEMHICRHLIRVAAVLLLVVPCAAEENDPVSVEPICSVLGLTDDATIPPSVCQITEDYTPFGSSLTSSPDPSIPAEQIC